MVDTNAQRPGSGRQQHPGSIQFEEHGGAKGGQRHQDAVRTLDLLAPHIDGHHQDQADDHRVGPHQGSLQPGQFVIGEVDPGKQRHQQEGGQDEADGSDDPAADTAQVVSGKGADIEGEGAQDLAEGQAVQELLGGDPLFFPYADTFRQGNDSHATAKTGDTDLGEGQENFCQGHMFSACRHGEVISAPGGRRQVKRGSALTRSLSFRPAEWGPKEREISDLIGCPKAC